MNDSKIPVRYARALFALAEEEHLLDEVMNDMQTILSVFSEVPGSDFFLRNPLTKTSEKQSLIDKIFAGHLQKITLSFMHLLLENKRAEYLSSAARFFIRIYKKHLGVMSALLITPRSVNKELRDAIINMVSKNLEIKIHLEEKTDDKLIGGFVLRVEDQQIDASVATYLKKIKKELINS